jgi:hypothetical protein
MGQEPTCNAQAARLFNDLIRDGENARRDFETERLRGVEINDKFNLGGLLHRQVGRFFALQDAADIDVEGAALRILSDEDLGR